MKVLIGSVCSRKGNDEYCYNKEDCGREVGKEQDIKYRKNYGATSGKPMANEEWSDPYNIFSGH
jgi:hypothetical protein